MPAITKDEAIQVLREALENIRDMPADGEPWVAASEALRATEHITDTAATQAAEKPQDGLVLPPMRGTDSQQEITLSDYALVRAAAKDLFNKSFADTEVNISAPSLGKLNSVMVAVEVFQAAMKATPAPDEQSSIAGSARAGRNAQPDSTTDLAPTDLSAVEVPPLPDAAERIAELELLLQKAAQGLRFRSQDSNGDPVLSELWAYHVKHHPEDWGRMSGWASMRANWQTTDSGHAYGCQCEKCRAGRASMKGNK